MNLEQYKLFQKCKNLPLWIINGYFRPHKKEHYKKDVWKFLIYKEDIELKNYCYKLSDNNEDCNAHSILEGYGYPGKLFAFNESGRANKMLCIIEEYNYKPLIDILPIFLISFLLSLSFFIGIFFVKETIN